MFVQQELYIINHSWQGVWVYACWFYPFYRWMEVIKRASSSSGRPPSFTQDCSHLSPGLEAEVREKEECPSLYMDKNLEQRLSGSIGIIPRTEQLQPSSHQMTHGTDPRMGLIRPLGGPLPSPKLQKQWRLMMAGHMSEIHKNEMRVCHEHGPKHKTGHIHFYL